MGVEVKNYRWHPVWHDERSQDEAYRRLPLDHIGALTEMERLAGQTNNNGSLSLYSDKRRRMTDEEVVEHLAERAETTKQRARKIFNRLKADKYIKVQPKTKIVTLTYWKRWQVKGKGSSAPSQDAGRQRDSRQRKREELMHRALEYFNTISLSNVSQPMCALLFGEWMGKTDRSGANLRDEMVKAGVLQIDGIGSVCSSARTASASAPPFSDSDSVSGCEPVPHSRDMSHIEENEEKEIDTFVSSNSVSDVQPPAATAPAGTTGHSDSSFGGGRSGRSQHHSAIDPRSIWDSARCEFTSDPRAALQEHWCVEAAQMITGDWKPYARNSWDKWITDWPGVPGGGVIEFQQAVADLIEILLDANPRACKCPAAYLNGILKRRVEKFRTGKG